MDGTGGLSHFNLPMNNTQTTDESLFAVTCTPLRVVSEYFGTLWMNPAPSSVRFVRPIKLVYEKESKELVLRTKADLQNQIEEAQNILFSPRVGISITLTNKFYLTVIDGKVLSFIVDVASFQRCPVCEASSKDMNNIENLHNGKFAPKANRLIYGISYLHLWIRLFELLLHVAYKKKIQKHRSGNTPDVKTRKEEIQTRFKDNLALTVDKVVRNGESSNTGNVARKAFANPTKFAWCLNFDEREAKIIVMLRTILLTIACQLPINQTKFSDHCMCTFKAWIDLFPWYPICQSLNKILIHGTDIINAAPLPLAVLSEEGAESKNKSYKFDRIHHARKISRKANNEDMFNRSLEASDPFYSSKCLNQKLKSRKGLPKDVLYLLDISDEELNGMAIESEDDMYFENFEELDNIELENIEDTESLEIDMEIEDN